MMTRRVIVSTLAIIVSFALGGGSVEYLHQRSDQQSKQAFDQKLRCKVLADEYIRGVQSKDENRAADLNQVDYSKSSNTCFASINVLKTYGASTPAETSWMDYELVDLVSGKVDLIGFCNENRDCGDGKDIKLNQELTDAFKQAIEGKNLSAKKVAQP